MRFDFEVAFDYAALTGDGTNVDDLAQITALMQAKNDGRDDVPIELSDGRRRTVGDIRAFRLEVNW